MFDDLYNDSKKIKFDDFYNNIVKTDDSFLVIKKHIFFLWQISQVNGDSLGCYLIFLAVRFKNYRFKQK